MTDISRLYGDSLYELAADEKLTDVLMEEMEGVNRLFSDHPDYIRVLSEMSIQKEVRTDMLQESFGGRVQPYMLNFLKLLCENGMMREFKGCCRAFRKRYDDDNQIARAVVTSAVPLDEQQMNALRNRLTKLTNKGIMLVQNTDSRVMGGLRVELEGKLLDGTVKGRLAGLNKMITEINL